MLAPGARGTWSCISGAYETKTGRELWRVATEQLISGANPITYKGKDGKQYVAVAAGTTLLTYTLP